MMSRARDAGLRARNGVTRDLLTMIVLSLLLIVAAFYVATRFIKPAPPDTLILTTGAPDGAYHAFASRYQAVFEREGVTLELKPSNGSVENLARLKDNAALVDAGFIQGGLGLLSLNPQRQPVEETTLFSLANLFYEPIWLFYQGRQEITGFAQLKGLRIAIGANGSGTRKVALELLAAAGVDASNTMLSDQGSRAARELLEQGKLDAVFLIAAPEAPVVQALLKSPKLHLMSVAQAEGYARRFPYLVPVTLPRGVVDLKNDMPARDVRLLASTANLVVREDVHPALAYLLLEAAVEVHGAPGLLQRPGDFPSPKATDFPLSSEAKRYFQSGRPFLQRYLPFWLANFIERTLVLLVPLVAVVYPLIKVLPEIFFWRQKNKIYKWYGELKFLEDDLARDNMPADERAGHLARLDAIESEAAALHVPLAFSDRVYTLRGHIAYVRQNLAAGAA
jgi:TRAP transporter TAXI family solute receptor